MGRTSSAVKDRYNAKAYDEIKVRVSKGKKDTIQAHAEAQGQSVNAYINAAIDEKMAQEAVRSPTTHAEAAGVSLPSKVTECVPAASKGRTEGEVEE